MTVLNQLVWLRLKKILPMDSSRTPFLPLIGKKMHVLSLPLLQLGWLMKIVIKMLLLQKFMPQLDVKPWKVVIR
jgi:hypothetical protein